MVEPDPPSRPQGAPGVSYSLAALALWAAVLAGVLLSPQGAAQSAHRGVLRRHLAAGVSCAHIAPPAGGPSLGAMSAPSS